MVDEGATKGTFPKSPLAELGNMRQPSQATRTENASTPCPLRADFKLNHDIENAFKNAPTPAQPCSGLLPYLCGPPLLPAIPLLYLLLPHALHPQARTIQAHAALQ